MSELEKSKKETNTIKFVHLDKFQKVKENIIANFKEHKKQLDALNSQSDQQHKLLLINTKAIKKLKIITLGILSVLSISIIITILSLM